MPYCAAIPLIVDTGVIVAATEDWVVLEHDSSDLVVVRSLGDTDDETTDTLAQTEVDRL